MSEADLSQLRGRILVVGGKSSTRAVLERLSTGGYFCAAADTPAQLASVAEQLKPEAILLAGKSSSLGGWLSAIRQNSSLSDLPLLADVVDGGAESLRKSGIDDYIHSYDELSGRLEAALRAKRLVERDQRSRFRMETLLEITQAAASSLDLEEILRIAVDKIGKVIKTDRCSVVLVEGTPRTARVVASREEPDFAPFQVDILRYPEIRKALATRESVLIEDATRDPLMEEVRRKILPLGVKSILVQPLVSQDDVMGALFLRVARDESSFEKDEVEFARAAAAAIANSVRNARLHAALKRKREDLEAAYVDRYRELNEANRRQKELNRLKDEIIAVVSHDLRAPLQVLLGHGRLLADAELEAQPHASAEAIVRQGKKILELVESLLEKGKGEQARLSLEPRLVDVAEMCQEQTAELEILATQRGVALRSETPESLLVVGDEVKLRQVLQNLIMNAITHASAAGVVVVRTQRLKRPDGEAVKILVEDDGRGIPVDQLHLVFDRYRHGPGGVGLGLAICKEFVELHGGEVWAERPPAGGTAFVVTLPLAQGPTRAGAAPKPQEPTVQPRVLVVEDEPEVAAVVTEILRSRYRVELARDGAEGLAKARALHPDLVVMDVFLPKLDGLDAAVALKSSSDTQDIPVILLSAHQGVAEKVRALNLGAVDYMSKPFQAVELLNRTDRAIKLRSTEKELQRSLNLLKRSGSDPETGLFDRAGLVSRIDQELARTRRYNRPVSVAVLRPDEPVGDRSRSCAEALRRRLRTPDVLGHLGMGNFGALLPECTAQTAHAVFARVLREVQEETGVLFKVSVVNVTDTEVPVEAVLDHLLAGKK